MNKNYIKTLSMISLAIIVLLCTLVIGYVIIGTLSTFNIKVFTDMGEFGIFPKIISTIYVTLIALTVGLSVGIFTAIYLTEYVTNPNVKKMFDILLSTLNAIPSVIFGLFGYSFFILTLGLPRSTLVGGLTLGIMILPTIIFVTKAAFEGIDENLRNAAYSMGGSKWKVIINIMFLEVKDGVLDAIVLSLAKILGESAALVITMGTVYDLTFNVLDESRTLASHMLATSHSDVLTGNEILQTLYTTGFVVLAISGILIFVSEKVLNKKGK